MTKIGVIGLGHMGGFHSSICATLPQATLTGVADLNPTNLDKVKKIGVAKSTDYNDWIEEVDGVIIALPTELHYKIDKECIIRGKHILLEKPLTKTSKEAEELFSLANQHNVTLHVGHVERFNGAIQELRKIVHEPFLIESHRMGPFNPRVAKDSVVLDLMIHDLDIILNMVNSPVINISAQGQAVYSDSCDIASVQLRFANGTIAHLTSSRASQIKRRTMAVHQKNEYLSMDFTTQDLTIHRHASSSVQLSADQLKYKQEGTVEQVFVYKDNPLKLEIEHFIKSITTGNNILNPREDLAALEITFAIEKELGLRC
jgi:predicted dehydrogenase